MEHNGNISARASTDERALPSPTARDGPCGDPGAEPLDDPQFATKAEADAWWAGVTHGLRCATGEVTRDDDEPPAPRGPREENADILDPSGRRVRVDGWLPWKKGRFLLVLVAGGIVADACRAVGMSVASAYALKNRRSGRAFGKMWDSILIHRARARLADNNLSRAMNGCVEQVFKDGVVVAERRRFDNRLSMAVLTRLDRLAESNEGEEADLLRALSEDFEDYLDVVESGGDEQAFLEARRAPKGAENAQAGWKALPPRGRNGRTRSANRPDWRLVDPAQIPVDDLDPNLKYEWTADQRQRAELSHYLDWLDEISQNENAPAYYGYECPAAFDRYRYGIQAPVAADPGDEVASEPSTSSTSPPAASPAGGGAN
ncbi:MAG: hypothetical protein WBR13_16175 [Allosphingosinicella sp.]